MLHKIVKIFGGDPNKRQIEKTSPTVEAINALEAEYEGLDEAALRAKTSEFRRRLAQGETLDDLLVEAFAVIREASKRTLGQRPFDVQLIGGVTLHSGTLAEMRTGEGKTLVSTLPLYLNALALNPEWLALAEREYGPDPAGWTFEPIGDVPASRGVHLVTVNDYLARRDARWMGAIFHLLGLSVGVLQMAARTENGRKAFLVDRERESPHEDQHQLRMVPRREAYAADITYGTNSEFGFDYLRDNMTMRLEDRVQRGHYFAVIDEVDNVLIDEARTPLIISGPASDDTEWYNKMASIVRGLNPEDYEVSEKDRNVTLTELGETHVEILLGQPLRDPERPEDITPEQARLLGYLEQALRAQFLFRKNKDYLVQTGKVIIIDEFTGRLMPGRRWSDGLHQAVEAKEGVKVESETVTYATITIQNYFRMYEKLAGMTGTAMTEAEEFSKIYKLEVLSIPTNLEYQASRAESTLIEVDDRDEQGYKFTYYTDRTDPQRKPLYWRRKDYPDVIFRTEEAKLRAIVQEILRYHVLGRPILVGTTSVELSERVSGRMRAEPVRRLAQVLLLRKVWMQAHKREEDGRLIPELAYLNSSLDQLPIPEMRKMARELEMSFSPEAPENLDRLVGVLELSAADKPRLEAALEGGIPHQVLNARKHTEESQIIAGAGAFGAVTIATNMAGRGVDIKLGGELAEEIASAVNRVLRKTGEQEPYDLSDEERLAKLLALDPAEYSIYESEVRFFMEHMDDMRKVKELGGLHVIGSERHESRRIDNQLRGRAARQGDPGSSRFYLSMEDELMRMFGGQQADNLMQRLKIDEALPLEVGLVSRLVEQSQTRVEGANFDVRKHLLEYDDVLNTQRAKIYAQRNRIFTKQDLAEDIDEMLIAEVNRRVPEALEEEDGAWKLLSWLEQIQPTLQSEGDLFPSFTIKLLAERLEASGALETPAKAIRGLLEIALDSLEAEEEHMLRSVRTLLEQSETRLDAALEERLEAVDNFFDALSEPEESEPRSLRQLQDELNTLAHFPVRLSSEEARLLRDDPERIAPAVRDQLEAALTNQAILRVMGAIQRRLSEDLDLSPARFQGKDWDELSEQVLDAVEDAFDKRRERLVGKNFNGQIARDLEAITARVSGALNESQLYALLLQMPQGAQMLFDKRTHKRVTLRTNRLTYIYAAGRALDNRDPEDVSAQVLAHLQAAQEALLKAWGKSEWARLASLPVAELDESLRSALESALGQGQLFALAGGPLFGLTEEQREAAVLVMGRLALSRLYRQVLLNVISELWVEYLTQMEALRVSIGLEAYAQRDPLVQYKNRAFQMFHELLGSMRQSVVNRMFTYRPRANNAPAQAAPAASAPQSALQSPAQFTPAAPDPSNPQPADASPAEVAEKVSGDQVSGDQGSGEQSSGGKRRRRRH